MLNCVPFKSVRDLAYIASMISGSSLPGKIHLFLREKTGDQDHQSHDESDARQIGSRCGAIAQPSGVPLKSKWIADALGKVLPAAPTKLLRTQ